MCSSSCCRVHTPVVWTNATYALAPLVALGHTVPFVVMLLVGLGLAAGSGLFHAKRVRWAQRLDVSAMMAYLVALAVTIAVETFPFAGDWAYLAVLAGAAYYALYTWEIDSSRHVPGWGVAAFLLLSLHSGLWALLPGSLFALGGYINLAHGQHSLPHAAWHVLGAGAVSAALWLLFW